MSADELDPRAVDVGIEDGLGYAVGFLLGASAGFDDATRPGYAKAFRAAADELARVTVDQVRLEVDK